MADDMDGTGKALVSLDAVRRKKQTAVGFYPRWLDLGLILNKQSEPYCNGDNVRKILAADVRFGTAAWYDADAKIVMFGDRIWSDADDNDLLISLQSDYGIPRMALEPVRQGVDQYARSKSRAPLTDWLNSLTWDGTDRLAHWLKDTYGCRQTDYIAAVGRCWLISLVARAFKPGCQVDTMVVLEGAQGLRKSSSLEVLGGQWYRAITQPFGSKEWLEAITGVVWLAEVADLSGFRGRDLDHLKAALTTRVDRYRRSYDRRAMDYPRRCVFTGTTNRDDWQADDTGGRRFLPVQVSEVNIDFIRANRDQLFAEAVHRYRAGESWWDIPQKEAQREQELRRDDDVWQPKIENYLEGRSSTNVPDLLEICLDIKPERQDKRAQMRVASILKVLGFQRKVERVGATTMRVWRREETQPSLLNGGNDGRSNEVVDGW
jgi:predicted P-loop ATPase